MDIKEFVKTSVKEIITAINELQEEFKDTNAIVSPRYGDHKGKGYCHDAECYIDEISFDLLVNAVDSSEKGGTGTIKVVSGNIIVFTSNISKEDFIKNISNKEESSRITFSIPLIYPTIKFKKFTDQS